MPQPTQSDLYVDRLLTNISLAYAQESTNFVAPQVAPVIRVKKQSGLYTVYDKNFFRRDLMSPRAPSTEAAGAGYEVNNTGSYYCNVFSLRKDIDDDEARNADEVFELKKEATMLLTQASMIRMERSFATDVFATSKWTGSHTGSDITVSNAWTSSSGTPFADVDLEKDSILKKTGYLPNKLVCGRRAWNALKNSDDVQDRIKHTSREAITTEMVARLLELDEIVVCNASYVSSAEGASSATNAFINEQDDALLLYVPRNPGRYTPSAAYTFVWSGDDGMGLNEFGAAIKDYRIERIKSDRVEINQYFDVVQTGADLGAYFDNVYS